MSTLSTYAQRKGNTNEATIAPNLVDLNATNDLTSLYDYSTLRQIFPEEIISDSEIQAAIEYRNAFKQGDVITSLCVFNDSVNSVYFRQSDFSLENILYWYQKLKYSNREIVSYRSTVTYYGQNILSNQIPGASRYATDTYNSASYDQNNYFDNISDSIGLLTNSKYLQLDSTLPIFDIGQDYYGVPVPYSASIENKLSASAKNVAYNLSRKTTTMMRHNLLGVAYTNLTLQQNLAADATVPHGLNLINDLPTFTQFNTHLDEFKNALTTVFPEAKLFSFIQYLNNIGNETAMNLRDIFPVQPSDKDFTVVTSEESAQASQAIANQEIADAQAEQALYAQQQGFINASTVNTTIEPDTTASLATADSTAPEGNVIAGSGVSRYVNGKLVGDGAMGVPDTGQLNNGVTIGGTLKCDTDGSPIGTFNDPTGQNDTSLHINGVAVDASKVPYVVVSPQNQRTYGIKTGDWALVTDNKTGNQVWGRVADVGPNQAPGEVSAAAVQALGYGVTKKGNIVAKDNINVKVTYYPGSKTVAGNTSKPSQYIASNS